MIIEYNAIVYSIKRGIVSPEQLENSSSKKLKKKKKEMRETEWGRCRGKKGSWERRGGEKGVEQWDKKAVVCKGLIVESKKRIMGHSTQRILAT